MLSRQIAECKFINGMTTLFIDSDSLWGKSIIIVNGLQRNYTLLWTVFCEEPFNASKFFYKSVKVQAYVVL